jgi:hypothetical protein
MAVCCTGRTHYASDTYQKKLSGLKDCVHTVQISWILVDFGKERGSGKLYPILFLGRLYIWIGRVSIAILSPLIANDRLRWFGQDKVALKLKRAWSDGTTELVCYRFSRAPRLPLITSISP